MRRKKANSESMLDKFFAFVRDNPELAKTLAFELGALAGMTVRSSSKAKRYLKNRAKKAPQALDEAMPPSIAGALKFLPSPKLQPRKQTKRSALRKAKHVSE